MKSNKIQWDFVIAIIRLLHPEYVEVNDDWGQIYTSVSNECPLIDMCEWAQRREVNNYVDEYGRYHHKPITPENPIPSNNGWIYTAYAELVGLPMDDEKLVKCYFECKARGPLIRSPGMPNPPISRDEILGLAALELLEEEDVPNLNFSPYPIPEFSLSKLISQLSELLTFSPASREGSWHKLFGPLYTRHRNYFWQNGLDQMYRFAFAVPLSDRHYILKKLNKFKPYNPKHLFYAAVAKLDALVGKPHGMSCLKYGTSAVIMAEEFPEDHPIRRAAANER